MRQLTFSRLWDNYESDQHAKAERDRVYREYRKRGFRCTRSVLKNQVKPYDGLGKPNGSSCDVYMLTIMEETNQ